MVFYSAAVHPSPPTAVAAVPKKQEIPVDSCPSGRQENQRGLRQADPEIELPLAQN
jgi:hypothetical protein